MNAKILKTYLVVAIGGGIGSMARYWMSDLGSTLIIGSFPWGVLMVNWLGCFVIGFFAEATGSAGMLSVSPDLRAFVMVGLCGGFTTFSSFSLGTLALWQKGQLLFPLANVGLSIVGCIFACAFGIWLVHFTNVSIDETQNREV